MDNFYNLNAVSEIIGDDAKKLEGKTILWTGTSGFLGQWVIRVIKYLNEFVLLEPCKLLAYDMRLPEQEKIDKFFEFGVHFYSHDFQKPTQIAHFGMIFRSSLKLRFVRHNFRKLA